MPPTVMRPCQEGGESHVTHLNFKTSCVGVYKCLSLIVGFAVTVAIWPREVVSCCDFILRAVATFWAMLLVGIYPGRASVIALKHPQKRLQVICCEKSNFQLLSCLRRQLPTFFNATTGLDPSEMTSEKRTQKFYADDLSLPKSW